MTDKLGRFLEEVKLYEDPGYGSSPPEHSEHTKTLRQMIEIVLYWQRLLVKHTVPGNYIRGFINEFIRDMEALIDD